MTSVQRSFRARARRFWPAFLLALIPCSEVFAAVECKALRNTWDDEWGAVRLGDDAKNAERAGLLKPCAKPGQCKYIDEAGVRYELDAAGAVIAKNFEVKDAPTGKLPLGLAPGDTLLDAVRKLRSERALEIPLLISEANYWLVSGLCFANGRGALYSVMMVFHPDGRLMEGGLHNEEATELWRPFLDWVGNGREKK